ncbi:MAG: hypothetical protein ABIQ16_16615 [Polyangiaceae bacterium]
MRLVDVVRALALLSVVGLVSGCPKKESEATPEPATVTPPTSDKAGAEPPAAVAPPAAAPPAAKKKDDGGW